MSQRQVVAYRATLLSSSNVAWKADIRCYNSTIDSQENALIRFYDEGAAIPPDGWVGGNVGEVPIIGLPISRFADVMTMLRSEDHVSVAELSYSIGTEFVVGWGISAGMEHVEDMDPTP